jgi:hypothetical protein
LRSHDRDSAAFWHQSPLRCHRVQPLSCSCRVASSLLFAVSLIVTICLTASVLESQPSCHRTLVERCNRLTQCRAFLHQSPLGRLNPLLQSFGHRDSIEAREKDLTSAESCMSVYISIPQLLFSLFVSSSLITWTLRIMQSHRCDLCSRFASIFVFISASPLIAVLLNRSPSPPLLVFLLPFLR